ncbi:MAG: hypothetical protein ETSY2_14775 [Candidatus Entotheonella gemina]|uniref:DUF4276 family protein n=1 Tax=Candidatus Entotheonella gemina TaxID=1429439 RepID=W4M9I8_9BACT|nr:MAG: hypothetical protein ETSY2_14775 [Candidatus Entotheonella gemina]
MRKLAIFMEGQTELIFVKKLVYVLGDNANVAIQEERVRGGRRGRTPRVVEMIGTNEPEGHEFFVLLIDCGQDERVKSDILDRYHGLVAVNYEQILAVRDVYPHSHGDVEAIREGFTFRLPNDPIQPFLILAIMEIEAWFLAEYSHFLRIHPDLTAKRIKHEFGFDVVNDDMQLRNHPSKDLEDIYFLETLFYHKTREHVEQTVNSLDFSEIRDRLATQITDLGELIRLIQSFFAERQ